MIRCILLFEILIFSTNIINGQVISISDCKKQSPFLSANNLDVSKGAFSTTERRLLGLVYLQYDEKQTAIVGYIQHPTWKMAGSLGPIVVDDKGAVWVAPIPTINVLHNNPQKQNRIYVVDEITGIMSLAAELPGSALPNENNPFGVMGLSYDCENRVLFASSIRGSSRSEVRGRIFSLELKDSSLTILDTLSGIDAMGLGVVKIDGIKRLFYGDARSGNIYSVQVDVQSKFILPARLECSLQNLGLRGDDIPRKIRFQGPDKMIVHGVEFYFNLIGPQEKQESLYTFKLKENKWVFDNVN